MDEMDEMDQIIQRAALDEETKANYREIFRQNHFTRASFEILTHGSNNVARELRVFMEEQGVSPQHIPIIQLECEQCMFGQFLLH